MKKTIITLVLTIVAGYISYLASSKYFFKKNYMQSCLQASISKAGIFGNEVQVEDATKYCSCMERVTIKNCGQNRSCIDKLSEDPDNRNSYNSEKWTCIDTFVPQAKSIVLDKYIDATILSLANKKDLKKFSNSQEKRMAYATCAVKKLAELCKVEDFNDLDDCMTSENEIYNKNFRTSCWNLL